MNIGKSDIKLLLNNSTEQFWRRSSVGACCLVQLFPDSVTVVV